MPLQYAFPPPPPGFKYEEFTYYFDQFNTPELAGVTALTSGQELKGVALRLQSDSPYLWRGVQVTEPTGKAGVRFTLPSGEVLSSEYVPVNLSYGFELAQNPGQCPVLVEDQIPLQAGSVIMLDIKNLS